MRAPSIFQRRWLIFGPAAVGAVLLVGYALLWRAGAAEMRSAIEDWAQTQRAAGLEIEYRRLRSRGFPLFLRSAVTDVVIADTNAWRWRAPQLNVDATPLALDRLVFSAERAHTLDLGTAGLWEISAPDGRASVSADKARGWIVDVESGSATILRREDGATLSAGRFLLTAAPAESTADTLEASIAIGDLTIAASGAPIAIESLEAMAAIAAADAAAHGLTPWREAGGRIEIRRLVLAANAARLSVEGVLTLDDAGRPAGALDAEIANPGAFAALLGAAGLIKPQAAETMAASLTLAAIAGGGKITAPLVLKDGEASIAGVKIGEFSRLQAAPAFQP